MLSFTKQAVDKLGIGSFPLELQEEILEKAGGIIFQNVLMRALNLLSAAEKDELEQLLAGAEGDLEKVHAYLNAHIPSLDAIVTEETEAFASESKTVMDALAKAKK